MYISSSSSQAWGQASCKEYNTYLTYPSGRLLGVGSDYLPNFKGLVSVRFRPHTPTGGCGGTFPPHLPPLYLQGGPRVVTTRF